MGAAALGVRAAPAIAATSSVTVTSSGPAQTRQAGGVANKRSRRLKANAFVRLAANRVAPAVVQLEVERHLPRASPQATLRKGEEGSGEEEAEGRGSVDGGEEDEFRETGGFGSYQYSTTAVWL
ncbi:unnamed protein product [Closterium sp. Naga37s-1]|nr:unnamed protein product [Closterium sp. Naga37s-1]